MPISLYELFNISPRTTNLLMCLPKINLVLSKQNFVFSGTLIWNNLIGKLLNKSSPGENGMIVPGSSECSDVSAPISFIKKKLKEFRVNKLDDSYVLQGEFEKMNQYDSMYFFPKEYGLTNYTENQQFEKKIKGK